MPANTAHKKTVARARAKLHKAVRDKKLNRPGAAERVVLHEKSLVAASALRRGPSSPHGSL